MTKRNLVKISQEEEVTREEFAFYVKSLRESLDLNIEQLAEKLQKPTTSIRNYETGKQIPRDPFTYITSLRNLVKQKRK